MRKFILVLFCLVVAMPLFAAKETKTVGKGLYYDFSMGYTNNEDGTFYYYYEVRDFRLGRITGFSMDYAADIITVEDAENIYKLWRSQFWDLRKWTNIGVYEVLTRVAEDYLSEHKIEYVRKMGSMSTETKDCIVHIARKY